MPKLSKYIPGNKYSNGKRVIIMRMYDKGYFHFSENGERKKKHYSTFSQYKFKEMDGSEIKKNLLGLKNI